MTKKPIGFTRILIGLAVKLRKTHSGAIMMPFDISDDIIMLINNSGVIVMPFEASDGIVLFLKIIHMA